jgi:hypothetical protein
VRQSTRRAVVVDRCPRCGAVVLNYEGNIICPDCVTWRPVEPLDDVESMLLWTAILLSEEGGAA